MLQRIGGPKKNRPAIQDARSLVETSPAQGQIFTPPIIAGMMASMSECRTKDVRVLDPGAGRGILFSSIVEHYCRPSKRPNTIHVTAYEIDEGLGETLGQSVAHCTSLCQKVGIRFSADVRLCDFLAEAADHLDEGLFGDETRQTFNLAILNPPYFKINNGSGTRKLLQRIGVETTNIYTGFLAATAKLLDDAGEMIAITPRSFCNGTYFRSFRTRFLDLMTLRTIHSFHSRRRPFREDDILQETVILRAVKKVSKRKILITSSDGPGDAITNNLVSYDRVVQPDDEQAFIHIPTDKDADQISHKMKECRASLSQLNLSVSTGRVVDFRAREFLRRDPEKKTVPLIYPMHFGSGSISWPKAGSKKANAIIESEQTASILVPNEHYVLVRRFSAKEEPRRIVAVIYDARKFRCKFVGFENHLNYFHRNGNGLELLTARGLAAYLNSTLFDQYFRQFSGHTQVNATDLRNMPYPTIEQIESIGRHITDTFPDQQKVDDLIEEELFSS